MELLLCLQVDYEAMKHENKRLQEDTEELHAELEELAKLKAIVEKNLDEALSSLQQEREQKHALKKELDQRLTTESMFNLHTLASLGLSDFQINSPRDRHESMDIQDEHEQEVHENPALKRIEADFSSQSQKEEGEEETPGLVGDLFSELHMTEIRKLEQLLEQSDVEKSSAQDQLEAARKEIAEQKEKITQMKDQLSTMVSVAASNVEENGEVNEGKSRTQLEQQYATALKQITELQEQLGKVKDLHATDDKEFGDDLKDEVMKLRNKVAGYEETIKNLEVDLKTMTQVNGETQSSLNCTQDELVKVTEDLAQLYHHVCEVNGETPNRVM